MYCRIITHIMTFLSLPIFSLAQPINFSEIYSKRTLYSKTYHSENGYYKTILSQKPLHYRPANGFFEEIDLTCTPHNDGYRNTTNTFESRFLSRGIQLIGNDNEKLEIQAVIENESHSPLNQDPVYLSNENSIQYFNDHVNLKYKLLRGRLHVIIDFLNSVDKTDSTLPFHFVLNSNTSLNFEMVGASNIVVKNQEVRSVFSLNTPVIRFKDNYIMPVNFGLIKENGDTSFLRFTLSPDFLEQGFSDLIRLEFEIESQFEPPFLSFPGIYKEYVNSSYTGIAEGFFGYVGNYPYDQTTEHRYRSGQYWDISAIPNNSLIDSIKFRVEISPVTTESFTINLKDVDHYYPGSLATLYDDWGTGTTYDNISVEFYTDYRKTFTSGSSFIQNFKDDLSQDWFGIGFYTSSETTPNRYAWCNTDDGYMEVFYYNPSVPYYITVHNSFGAGYFKVIFQGNTTQHPSGDVLAFFHGDQVGLLAEDQQHGNYFYIFQNEWWRSEQIVSTSNPYNFTVTEDATFEARFLRRFDFEVHLDLLNGGSGGTINVNGQPQSAPYFAHIIEGNNIQIEAPSQTQTVNGHEITYNFLRWSDGNTSNPRNFTPTGHTQINAVMKGHFVSSSPTALAHNGGRKVWTNPGWDR